MEVLHSGQGQLVCCGQPVELLVEKDEDEGQEKYVPVIEQTEKGIKVMVGSIPHPMEENHYIEWVELIVSGNVDRQFLRPGEAPETQFRIKIDDIKTVQPRAYCNFHGLWRSSGK